MKRFVALALLAVSMMGLGSCSEDNNELPSVIYSDPFDIGGIYNGDGLYRSLREDSFPSSVNSKPDNPMRDEFRMLGVGLPTIELTSNFNVEITLGMETGEIAVRDLGDIGIENCRDFLFTVEAEISNGEEKVTVGQANIDILSFFEGTGYRWDLLTMVDGRNWRALETSFPLAIDFAKMSQNPGFMNFGIGFYCYDALGERRFVYSLPSNSIDFENVNGAIRFIDFHGNPVTPNPYDCGYIVVPELIKRMEYGASDLPLFSLNDDNLIRNPGGGRIAVALPKKVPDGQEATAMVSLSDCFVRDPKSVPNADRSYYGEVINFHYTVSEKDAILSDSVFENYEKSNSRSGLVDANFQTHRAYAQADPVVIPTDKMEESGEFTIALTYDAHYDKRFKLTYKDGMTIIEVGEHGDSPYEPNWTEPERVKVEEAAIKVHYEKKDGYCYFSYSGDFDEEEGNNAHWYVDPDLFLSY